MRPLLFGVATFVLSTLAASAQTAPHGHPYGLDPYKPSDAAILREYGAALVSQTPVQELAALDPYKPSHAALLRLAGGLPVWAIGWPSWLVVLDRERLHAVAPEVPSPARHRPDRAEVEPSVVAPEPTAIATLRRPESNDGVWIAYDGRRWLLSGHAVEHEAAAFQQVGQLDGHPVYQRRSGDAALIYVEGGGGRLVSYREKR
jgi:hypothetical protein